DGVCAQLLEALDGHSVAETSQAWLEQSVAYTEQERTAWLTGFNSSKQPMHPGRCAHEVAEFLRREQPEFTVVADGGDSSLWIREAVTVSAPGQLISWGPNGTIGTGLGFAIGAWFGRRKPVLLFTGDGSFGFHATELDTVARFQIPLIVVIANDSAWGVIKGTEQLIRPAAVAEHGNLATEFSEMLHYEKLGEIWGIDGELVRDFDEIGAALRRAVSTGRPYIINVEISQEDFSPVIAAYGASVKSGG
ncbi:MAG: thiamine pyrophosphate-dependent enzyme, partial [Gimesia chilikensis]